MAELAAPVLDVRGLTTVFRTRGGEVHAVNAVSFHLNKGELLGVVGESGSGKSVTMMSLIGLLPQPPAEIRAGQVVLNGVDILTISQAQLREVRGAKIGFIFQDPMTSLNPVFTIGNQIAEPLRKHKGMTKSQAADRAVELLDLVGIPDARARLGAYPHQFSGGMRQRVMIAIALACDPDVLIADEPTTALDVTIQAQILELVKELRQKLGMAIIWITHDLGVIAGIADRVMVMYGGQVVEQAPVKDLFANPQHPYTRALLKTIPSLTGKRQARLQVIEGQPPIMSAPPIACAFRARCGHAHDKCHSENPQRHPIDTRALGTGHDVACHWTPTSVATETAVGHA
jgi:peptide/nickel transport system ATP-binding protein/oligopeptide transport system ATP-binding protein